MGEPESGAQPRDGRADGQVDERAVRALRAAGLSVTAPRRAVYRTLLGADRPVSAAEVFDLLRLRGARFGLPSVYRSLHSFAAAGLVHVFPGDEQRFRICHRGPHVHLICEVCGRVVEQPVEVVSEWLTSLRRTADFVVDLERTDVYGRCGRCGADAHVHSC